MNKSKIEWCDSTWNPVTGCLHTCPYCYARRIANRFGDQKDLDDTCIEVNASTGKPYPYGFSPTFHRYRLGEPAGKAKGQNIFVCSMADLFGEWVPDEWIKAVFADCETAQQHNYLFLTKNPNRYLELYQSKKLPYGENIWLGTTLTTPADEFVWARNTPYKTFVSIEPLLEPFGELEYGQMPDWVIIGAETGNRKGGRVMPKPEWIMEIADTCIKNGIPVFMKESIAPIIGERNMLREFPEGLKR